MSRRENRQPPHSPEDERRPPRRDRRPRHRRRPWQLVLMIIGALALGYLLMRYAIVPLLVWIGG